MWQQGLSAFSKALDDRDFDSAERAIRAMLKHSKETGDVPPDDVARKVLARLRKACVVRPPLRSGGRLSEGGQRWPGRPPAAGPGSHRAGRDHQSDRRTVLAQAGARSGRVQRNGHRARRGGVPSQRDARPSRAGLQADVHRCAPDPRRTAAVRPGARHRAASDGLRQGDRRLHVARRESHRAPDSPRPSHDGKEVLVRSAGNGTDAAREDRRH